VHQHEIYTSDLIDESDDDESQENGLSMTTILMATVAVTAEAFVLTMDEGISQETQRHLQEPLQHAQGIVQRGQ
jgi:hypothetical protein